MNRARLIAAASIVGAAFLGASAVAEQAQPMQPILSGKKFTPPIKGVAEVQFTQPVTKREKNMVVTTIQVKNVSNAPIPRLTVTETWYDAKNNVVTGGKGVINGLLQPNEVATVKIETPFNPAMKSNNWNFSHANGDVKPKKVAKLEGAEKEPAAKTASAKKK